MESRAVILVALVALAGCGPHELKPTVGPFTPTGSPVIVRCEPSNDGIKVTAYELTNEHEQATLTIRVVGSKEPPIVLPLQPSESVESEVYGAKKGTRADLKIDVKTATRKWSLRTRLQM